MDILCPADDLVWLSFNFLLKARKRVVFNYFFKSAKIKKVQANKNRILPIIAGVLPTLPRINPTADNLNNIQPINCNALLLTKIRRT